MYVCISHLYTYINYNLVRYIMYIAKHASKYTPPISNINFRHYI